MCLCQYTNSGHCGQLCGHEVDNDSTLELLAKVAVSQAEAGADIIAPSDMMDGRISVIRNALDTNRFSHISVMSYAVSMHQGITVLSVMRLIRLPGSATAADTRWILRTAVRR